MVIGIGTDLVKLSRIEDSLQRFGERFVSRVLTEQEMQIFEQKQRSIHYFAKRWAAKEAAAKALISVGDYATADGIAAAELAAWTSIARVILNLHETITRY